METKELPSPRKVAVCTTFPTEHFQLCAAEMLATFKAYWPEDIKIFVQLDEQPEADFNALNNAIVDIVSENRVFIAGLYDDGQKAFMERWKNHKPKSYIDDVVKFSHKVFALEKCADALKDTHDVLIWLDADVITKRPITHEWLEEVLPGENEVCSYLGRDTLYSECGWVAYNLKCQGLDLLQSMKKAYTDDWFKNLTNGWTDCHVFDFFRDRIDNADSKNLSPFFKYGTHAIDVWPQSKLAEKTVHRKGRKKVMAAENRGIAQGQQGPQIIDANNLNIKTRNCLDHEKIRGNIRENLSQIRSWAAICKPIQDQEIVICSAGPSLSEHIDEIKRLQEQGAKIISVKHAIDTLKRHKVKPWAVVLLDPREHVEGFVQKPDPDPIYFVASMCNPNVVKTLNENFCKVIGYHALVNAGETQDMIPSDLPIGGGSATATRSIAVFADMFGYRKFHLFGYDLCYPQKPDMDAKNEDGQAKYMELNLGTHTYANKYITRTFWTEGQFLAQSNELKALYKDRKDINITVYGDGMAGWLFKHHNLHQQYMKEYNENLDRKRVGTPDLDALVAAMTRGTDFTRGK